MDLAIVVVSYNTRELTAECLDSVYAALAAEALDAHVWVIDNDSADGSAEMVRQRFPQATCIASAENVGFAAGTNLGLQSVMDMPEPPRLVMLLNPDTRVLPGALSEMVVFLESNPRAGIAGAQLLYADGSFQHGAFRFPTLWMSFFDFWTINHRLIDSRLNGRYPRGRYEAGEPFRIDHPLGAALMTRFETLQQVGLLDTGYFMYCEEIDWCMRAKCAGWQAYCVPKARIIHHAGQSASQFRHKMFVALWQSRYRLFSKHYGAVYRRVVRWIVRAGLRRQVAQTRRDLLTGELDAKQAEQKIAALQTVMGM